MSTVSLQQWENRSLLWTTEASPHSVRWDLCPPGCAQVGSTRKDSSSALLRRQMETHKGKWVKTLAFSSFSIHPTMHTVHCVLCDLSALISLTCFGVFPQRWYFGNVREGFLPGARSKQHSVSDTNHFTIPLHSFITLTHRSLILPLRHQAGQIYSVVILLIVSPRMTLLNHGQMSSSKTLLFINFHFFPHGVITDMFVTSVKTSLFLSLTCFILQYTIWHWL